jgi:phosphohistidine phosphatase SixA
VLSELKQACLIGSVALSGLFCVTPGHAADNDGAPTQIVQADIAQKEPALWDAMRSGDHVALLRHAIAPGSGDPAGFSVDDCATQRNLSDAGRDQARRIGSRFRENGIAKAAVFSSQWCRCLETARLLGLGPVTGQPILNSFFRNFERSDSQTRMLRQWIAAQNLTSPLVLVTHQVNITALTDVYPQSGELVIVRRDKGGELSVVGTIRTD